MSVVSVTFNNELLYLAIGGLIGVILGFNIASLVNRLFRGRFSRESQLRRRINELETKITEKDRLIKKAIRAAKTGHVSDS